MIQLSCKNITIAYEKENVIKDLSMDVESGDYISIVGENGTGKSSLLKGILGLVSVRNGIVSFGDEIKRNHIGYLSQQNPMQKDFPASVYEVVLSGCLNSKGKIPFYSSACKQRALKNLSRLGMSDLLNTSFADLSGGQKQRVLLARALCATDKIVFLDEPITGLDPIATSELYLLIEKLNKEYGITVVMVTHDIKSALLYSNKILHLNKDGYFFGSKKEYVNSEYSKALETSR